ncbi:hypothetical protein ABZ876_35090 [Streptomyces sp. NPDC046931]|uniref:hypothetical protein n=1 Tax=Streptomyces sp. NPDC046931 TaxID=3154806 RepID=UPI0033DFA0B5
MPIPPPEALWTASLRTWCGRWRAKSVRNPSLTAIANALRVGDHIAERLGARPVAAE